MKTREVAKFTVGMVVGSGIGTIVGMIVNATIPSDIGKIKYFTVVVGGVALSGYAGMKVQEFTDNQIDILADMYVDMKTELTKEEI